MEESGTSHRVCYHLCLGWRWQFYRKKKDCIRKINYLSNLYFVLDEKKVHTYYNKQKHDAKLLHVFTHIFKKEKFSRQKVYTKTIFA